MEEDCPIKKYFSHNIATKSKRRSRVMKVLKNIKPNVILTVLIALVIWDIVGPMIRPILAKLPIPKF